MKQGINKLILLFTISPKLIKVSTIFLFLLILSTSQLYTQPESNARSLYNEAEGHEAIGEYILAVPLYKKLVDIYPENANYNFKLGLCLVESFDHTDALPYLLKACGSINKSYRSNYKQVTAPPLALFYLAKEYHKNYQFSKALSAYSEYETYLKKATITEQNKVAFLKKNCLSGIELLNNPENVKHVDFSEAESVMNFAHSPIFSPDGSVYIFTTDKKPGKEVIVESNMVYDENIYFTYFSNGKWDEPQILSSNIISSKNEASIGLHPNGKQLLIYRDDNGDGNIYYSDLLDGKVWSKPKKFPSPINTTYQESHASLSADGNTVFFSSNRPGGYGGIDLYLSKRKPDGSWSKAVNLGPYVNSQFHDEGPHFESKTHTLYFSSDRPESMGGFDIFYCKILNDSVNGKVYNIGYPINTPQNDLFFKTTADGATGYYSTTCLASRGEMDLNIVQFLDIKKKANVRVKGLVLNGEGDTLVNLKVNLFDIAKRDIVDSCSNSELHHFYEFDLFSERRYFASFLYGGYVYFSKPFEVDKFFARLSFSNIIELEPIVLNDSSFRQSAADFVYTSRIMKQELLTQDDNLEQYDILSLIDTQTVAHISVDNSKLAVADRKDEPKQVLEIPNLELPNLKDDTVKYDIVEVSETAPQELGIVEGEASYIGDNPNPVKDKRLLADSIKREGIRHFDENQFSNAMSNFTNAIDLYKDLADENEQLDCLQRLADTYEAMGETQRAIDIHNQAIALAGNKKKITGKHLYSIGSIYDNLFLKSSALQYLISSNNDRKVAQDKEGELQSTTRIADVYFKHNDFNNAIDNYDKAIDITDELKLEEKSAELYNKKGLSNQSLMQYTNAYSNFNSAIEIAKKYNNKKAESIYLNNIANAKYDQNEYEDAITYYNQSIEIKRQLNYTDGLAISLHNLANSHRKLNQFIDALRYYNESLEISENNNLGELSSYNHFGLSHTYAALEKYNQALLHFKKYIDYRSPYLNKDFALQASQDIPKYEISQQDISMLQRKIQKEELFSKLETERYNNQISYLEQAEKRQELYIIMLFGFSIGAIGLLIMLLLGIRAKRKTHEALFKQNLVIVNKNEQINNQRKKLELLHVELEKLSLVASKTANAVAIINASFQLEWTNDAYNELFKPSVNKQLSIGSSLFNMAPNADVKERIQLCIDTRKSVDIEYDRPDGNGGRIWLQTSLTPITFDNEIYKIILIDSDITSIKEAELEIKQQHKLIALQRDEIVEQRDIAIEQKDEIEKQKDEIEHTINQLHQTQKKLIESEKMASLGNLVAGVAHEINTPVGIGIAASTSLMTKTRKLASLFSEKKMTQSDLTNYLATARDAAKLIQTNLQRTGDLVKSFKRVSVDEVTEQVRKFELKQYFEEVIISLAPKIRERNAKVSIECSEIIEIKSYPGAFAQILTNFIVNSISHAFSSSDNAQIKISIQKMGNTIQIIFIDNGCGMTEDVRRQAFNPFFTTNMQSGAGLGLNIVYNIVTQKLKGEISCVSEPGKGASFIIDIPAEIEVATKLPQSAVNS